MTLRELRESRGLSLLDVERSTGIHRGTLSKIERGLEVPSGAVLNTISEALGVSVSSWTARVMLVCPDEEAS